MRNQLLLRAGPRRTGEYSPLCGGLLYAALRLVMSAGGLCFSRARMRNSVHIWTSDRSAYPYPSVHFGHGVFMFSGILSLLTGMLGVWAAVSLLAAIAPAAAPRWSQACWRC